MKALHRSSFLSLPAATLCLLPSAAAQADVVRSGVARSGVARSRDAAVSLERAIPQTSRAVIEFAGLAACGSSWREHGLSSLVDHVLDKLPEEQRHRLLQRWRDRVRPRARRLFARAGVSPATVRALLQGPCAVLVGRATVASGLPIPSVALLVDVRRQPQSARRLVRRLLRRFAPDRSAEAVIEGVQARSVHVGQPAVDRVYVAVHGGKLLVSNSRGFFVECLRAAKGQAASLADHPPYLAGRKHLTGRKLVSVWIDTQPWMAALQPFLPYEADDIAAALGLGELRGVFLGAGTDGEVGMEVCHLGWRGDRNGLFRAPIAKPASTAAAKLCSPDTVAFATAWIDPVACRTALQRIVHDLPEWMRRAAHRGGGRQLADAERIGRYLSMLTGEVTVACVAPRVLPIPEVSLFIGVRDAAEVTEHLVHLMRRLHGDSYRTQKFLDADIHSVVVEVKGVGLAPCFTCRGGMLMVSTHPRILKATLRRAEKGGPSLHGTQEFQRVLQQVEGSPAFGYVATGQLVERVMGMAEVQAALRTQLIRAGFDPGILPETELLRNALAAVVVGTAVDRDGFTATCRSPLGEGSWTALLGYLVDRILRDVIGRKI